MPRHAQHEREITRSARGLGIVAVVCLGLPALALAAEPIRLRVEFMQDGRCDLTGSGPAFRANLSYTPPSPAVAELRCALPGAPKGQAVSLTVLLPPGLPRSGGEFPAMRWELADRRWVGRADLPSAPAFVRVPRAGSRSARLGGWLDALAIAATAIAILWSIAYGRRA